MYMLRGIAIKRWSRSSVRRNPPLRGRTWSLVRVPSRSVWSVSGRYFSVHLLVHAGVPVTKPREEENVLGTVRVEMQVFVWPRHGCPGGGRRCSGFVRLLQWLRRYWSLVDSNSRQLVHTQPRPGAIQVILNKLNFFILFFQIQNKTNLKTLKIKFFLDFF